MKSFIQTDCKSVVFDMDNTLYDEANFFKKVIDELAIQEDIKFHIDLNYKKLLNLRLKSKDIFYDILSTDDSLNRKDILILKDKLFNLAVNHEFKISPYDDLIPFLEYLSELKINKYILTNGVPAIQKNKFKSLSLKDFFGTNFYSAREIGCGSEKPEVEVFQRMLDITGNKNHEVLFIGDNPKTDFNAPFLIGCKSMRLKKGIYKNQIYNNHIDYEVNSYLEVI